MMKVCSSSLSEQESDSNQNFGLSSSMDFRALRPTHLRMIHELGTINQQH